MDRTQRNKKKKLQLEKDIQFKRDMDIEVDKYYQEFSKLETDAISDLVTELSKDYDYDNLDLQYKIEALKRVVDEKLYKQDFDNPKKFDYPEIYPDITDPNFNKKIYVKKEFNDYKILPLDTETGKTLDQIANDKCGINKDKLQIIYNNRELSSIQHFIKNFISPSTPYNGVLMYYGVGVGKTCSAISIAEQFRQTKRYKKIIVLLSPSIQENFKKELFDINSFYNQRGYLGCTGDSLLQAIGDADYYIRDARKNGSRAKSKRTLSKKINRFIRRNYTFMGYDKFAGYVFRLEQDNAQGETGEERLSGVKDIIKETFSNTVMIIDEAHHLREASAQSKYAPPIIERVLKYAENIKLVLLTATPMYDSPREIVSLLNLLLTNDNKPTLKAEDIFDEEDELTVEGKEILIRKMRGYVSYMRGENPVTFPIRLDADINDTDTDKIGIMTEFPDKDLNGETLTADDKIDPSNIKIIGCPMSKDHSRMYSIILNKQNDGAKKVLEIMESGEVTPAIPKTPATPATPVTPTQKFLGSFNISIGLQLSNLIYSNDVGSAYGKKGLRSVFTKSQRSYIYNDEDNEIFSPANIGTYSSKIKKILDTIKTSTGIIFIYSQFIDSGIIPLALALEHHGYKRFGGKQLLDSENKLTPSMGKYIMITSMTNPGELSENLKEHINILNSPGNINGDKIKVVLGSPAASEGLSFLRVREIHVLDPWHNFNRIEQVNGRGIRNCSHKDLPIEKRNITIYYYASIIDLLSTDETVDLKTYRIAEKKSLKIAKVERTIKINAIDCNLMKENNYVSPSALFHGLTIETSQNNQRVIDYYDKDNSRNCNYTSCEYECNPSKDELEGKETTKDTYNRDHSQHNVNKAKNIIRALFEQKFIYRIEDITTQIKTNIPKIEDTTIFETISEFMKKRNSRLVDKYERPGYLIHRGVYYIFQPLILDDNTLPLYYRRTPLMIKNSSAKMEKLISANKSDIAKDIDKTPEKDITKKFKESIMSIEDDDDDIRDSARSMVFERLGFKLTKELYSDLILNPEAQTEFHKFLLDNYDHNIIRQKHMGRKGPGKEDIIGFRIGNSKNELKYYCHDGGNKVKECSRYKRGKYQRENPSIPRAKHIGYMEKILKKINIERTMNPTLIPSDMENYKTNVLMKYTDDISSFKGARCVYSRIGREVLKDIVKSINESVYASLIKKKITENKLNLCHAIELGLRLNDRKKKDGKRWFYTIEETISMGFKKPKAKKQIKKTSKRQVKDK